VARGLTKLKIVEAGLDVLDEAGIDRLTVRAVAERLGVQAPALYWHVRGKQELLDEMATEIWRQVAAELAALPEATPWPDGMRAFAASTRRILLSHRDGAKVFSGTYLTDPELLRAQESPLAWMLAQGFSLRDVMRAYSLLYSFVVGFCIEEQSVRQAQQAGDDRYSLDRRAERLAGADTPLVLQAGPEIFGDPDARFADLVGVLIDAADRMRSAAAGQADR
jgi:TetR/AcrR family transcriptional regulator, tetracycline repressor protein